jgi:hypothetical protein
LYHAYSFNQCFFCTLFFRNSIHPMVSPWEKLWNPYWWECRHYKHKSLNLPMVNAESAYLCCTEFQGGPKVWWGAGLVLIWSLVLD